MSFICRTLLAVALPCGLASSLLHAAPTAVEQAAISSYQQSVFQAQLKDIHHSAGFAVPVEVDWDSIALPGQAAHYGTDDYWTNVYFVPLAEALDMLTSYDLGRQAMKDKLKRIVIRYDASDSAAHDYRRAVAFESGVLSINFRPASAAGQIEERTEAIQSSLETAL
ncbi:hypothetical protein QO207_19525 [Pseudomonas sp. CAN2814]|uniref:hypothetical protein n=1 Tax=Pseudomonas sp. CAN1 TaxID=3046726 RepID=UPI002649C515|nr:hypothetical protein [Pseudomonas sp. CAN1]MDN6858789.1 hypothetical protein [Pseudomonas sp. CAN1]